MKYLEEFRNARALAGDRERGVEFAESALADYKASPDSKEAMLQLMRLAMVFSMQPKQEGPALAIMDTLAPKFAAAGKRIPMLTQLSMWNLRRRLVEDRPGWNDYWMVRWQLDNSNLVALHEMHTRSAHLGDRRGGNWPMVAQSAAWMVASYRGQNATYDSAISIVEQKCPLCRALRATEA